MYLQVHSQHQDNRAAGLSPESQTQEQVKLSVLFFPFPLFFPFLKYYCCNLKVESLVESRKVTQTSATTFASAFCGETATWHFGGILGSKLDWEEDAIRIESPVETMPLDSAHHNMACKQWLSSQPVQKKTLAFPQWYSAWLLFLHGVKGIVKIKKKKSIYIALLTKPCSLTQTHRCLVNFGGDASHSWELWVCMCLGLSSGLGDWWIVPSVNCHFLDMLN